MELIKGDCLKIMKNIPDGSVDLILCDPPYGINYKSNKTNRHRKIANDKAPFIWWLYDAKRVLKDTGCLVTFFRWDVQEEFLRSLEIAGLPANGVCVWDKGGGGMGDLKRQFMPAHELFAFSPLPGFTFPGKRPSSVLHIPKVPSSKMVHPNQKPVELYEALVKLTSKDGATVLDPFLGSGTSGVAVKRVGGRRFIGIEQDDQYFDIARENIKKE